MWCVCCGSTAVTNELWIRTLSLAGATTPYLSPHRPMLDAVKLRSLNCGTYAKRLCVAHMETGEIER